MHLKALHDLVGWRLLQRNGLSMQNSEERPGGTGSKGTQSFEE